MKITLEFGPNKSGKTERLVKAAKGALANRDKVIIYSSDGRMAMADRFRDTPTRPGELLIGMNPLKEEEGIRFFDNAHSLTFPENFEPRRGDWYNFSNDPYNLTRPETAALIQKLMKFNNGTYIQQ